MKAVVVEIRNHVAAVLTDDGSIVKTKNDHYAIGEEIKIKVRTGRQKIVALAASFAIFLLLCGSGVWAYAAPYSYVSLDVNPSIEYTLNIFDRVLQVKAVNDDGEKILQQTQLKNLGNQTIETAIRETVQKIVQNGYFAGSGAIVITTSSQNKQRAHELAVNLKQDAEIVTEQECNDDVEVHSDSVGFDRVQEARTLGVTPGKLNLVERLKESSSNPNQYDLNEWLKKPVKEIMKAIKNNRGSIPDEPTETTAPESSSPEVSETPSESSGSTVVPENTDNIINQEAEVPESAQVHSNFYNKKSKATPSASLSPSPAASPADISAPSESLKPSPTSSSNSAKNRDRQEAKDKQKNENKSKDKTKNSQKDNGQNSDSNTKNKKS